MGIQCTEYLRLSPGELEQYTKETSQQNRLQRLQQVRRQASLAAQQQRRSSQLQKRVEEKALKTVEVRAELAAKRRQLDGLLRLKEACHADCNAMESAQMHKVEEEARRCAAEVKESERQKQEALRCLEACRQRKAMQTMQAEEVSQRRRQRQEVRSQERQRARRAASQQRLQREAEAQVRREVVEAKEKVLKTDVLGLQQRAQTCYQVLHESLGAEERPRKEAPRPTQAQLVLARSRGLAAQEQLRARRREEEELREKEEAERKERQAKAASLAQQWAVSREATLLPWQLNSKVGEKVLGKILDCERQGSLHWEALRPKRCKAKGKAKAKAKVARCVTKWLGPAQEPEDEEPEDEEPEEEQLEDELEDEPEEPVPKEPQDEEPQDELEESDKSEELLKVPQTEALHEVAGGAPDADLVVLPVSLLRESDTLAARDFEDSDATHATSERKEFQEPWEELPVCSVVMPRVVQKEEPHRCEEALLVEDLSSTSSSFSRELPVLSLKLPAPRPAPLAPRRRASPAKTRQMGEEDLALRLDEICKELDAVGLCAWEDFD